VRARLNIATLTAMASAVMPHGFQPSILSGGRLQTGNFTPKGTGVSPKNHGSRQQERRQDFAYAMKSVNEQNLKPVFAKGGKRFGEQVRLVRHVAQGPAETGAGVLQGRVAEGEGGVIYRPDQQHNMRSRMESYTPREFDRAVGDGPEEPDYEPEPEEEEIAAEICDKESAA
jgi:hypothetical protein